MTQAITQREAAEAPLPAKYEAARLALAECESVDECQTWAEKAKALASYARQAEDESLLKMAERIRARAMRRAGELLSEIPAKAGGRGKSQGGETAHHLETSARAQAAKAAGLSPDQTKDVLRVARIPEGEFEEAVESDHPPTVAQFVERGTSKKSTPLKEARGKDWICALTLTVPHSLLPRVVSVLRRLGFEGGGGSSRKMKLKRVEALRDA